MRHIPFTLVLLFALHLPALAADGDVDPDFGDAGQLTIERPPDLPTSTQPTGDLALLADGRYLWIAPVSDGHVWVGRMFADGSPDPAFGNEGNGRVLIEDCSADLPARLVAEADGGAVVWTGACLLRLGAGGDVDAGFSAGSSAAAGLEAAGLARDALGRYVLAGTRQNVWQVYRFDAHGDADPAFGNQGKVEVGMPSVHGQRGLEALALRGDGRIVMAGWRSNTSGSNLVIAQLLDDGSPDPDWNGGVIVDRAAPPDFNGISATAIAIDRDGSLVVSGRGNNGGTSCCILLARFSLSGALVPEFGLNLFPLAGLHSLNPFFEMRESLTVLPGGHILIGTLAFPVTPPFTHRTQYTLVRALADGAIDASFGNAGWIGYTIADPGDSGLSGDYNQLHGMAYGDGGVLMYGRTFFEDNNSLGVDYLSFVRITFDHLFADGFDG